jgi:hypothetical protein
MKILSETTVQKDKFRSAANKLLNSCFVLKKKESTRNDYIFILQNKDLFIEYFDLLGYRIEINEMHGVASLVNTFGTGRLRFKKIESVMLLILRLLYIEKRKDLSLHEEVVVFCDEIHEKYNMLKIQTKPNLDKTFFRETVKLFKRYNIISNIDADITMADARIKIYPSVLFAVPGRNINEIYDLIEEKLQKYVNGNEIHLNGNENNEFLQNGNTERQ